MIYLKRSFTECANIVFDSYCSSTMNIKMNALARDRLTLLGSVYRARPVTLAKYDRSSTSIRLANSIAMMYTREMF